MCIFRSIIILSYPLSQDMVMSKLKLIFKPHKNLVIIKCSGDMQVKSLLEACDEALSDPQYKKGMGRIWDVFDADLSQITTEQVHEITSYLTTRADDVNYVRVGIVAGNSLGFGLARVFSSVSDHTAKNKVMPFRSLEDAEEWVSEGFAKN